MSTGQKNNLILSTQKAARGPVGSLFFWRFMINFENLEVKPHYTFTSSGITDNFENKEYDLTSESGIISAHRTVDNSILNAWCKQYGDFDSIELLECFYHQMGRDD